MDKHNQIERGKFVEEELTFKPVTPSEWVDLVTLFSEHGVQNGCWCMYWRIPRKEFQRNYGEGNNNFSRKLLKLAPCLAFSLITNENLLAGVRSRRAKISRWYCVRRP